MKRTLMSSLSLRTTHQRLPTTTSERRTDHSVRLDNRSIERLFELRKRSRRESGGTRSDEADFWDRVRERRAEEDLVDRRDRLSYEKQRISYRIRRAAGKA